MIDAHFLPGRASRPMLDGRVGCAIMLIAALALAQEALGCTASRADGSSALVRRVADERAPGPGSFADLAEKVEPAVIAVFARSAATGKSLGDDSFGLGTPNRGDPQDERTPESGMPRPSLPGEGRPPKASAMVTIGSGFFISPDGYAVTNDHVIEGSDTAEIRTNDKKTYSAKVVGRDPLSDIALIKVDGRNDFTYVKLADQVPRVGDWVLTVGNAFGLGGTVTAGIVSARQRNLETGSAEEFLQIDAPINNGDSGGPSFNTRGEVIGINSMIFSPSGGSVGVAFAVPADTVKAVIPQLKDKGVVTRGWMGAELQSMTPELADSLGRSDLRGAIVANVQRAGPAAKAGLATGDIITSASGQPIRSANELAKKIYGMTPGASIQLGLLRHGKEQGSVDVKLGQMPNRATPGSPGQK